MSELRRDLLELLPVGVFVQDAEMRIQWVNSTAVAILGFERDAAIGRRCDELLRCSFCGPACASCAARAGRETVSASPVEVTVADGSRRSLLIDAVPLHNRLVAVVLCDVTGTDDLAGALEDRAHCCRLIRRAADPAY